MSNPVLTQGAITDVHSAAEYDIGTRRTDEEGNVYVYLQGIGSVANGDFVTYYITSAAASVTARLVANAIGLVAVAQAAIVAAKFGWFMIAGNDLTANITTAAAAGAALYATATAGRVDDTKVTGDLIVGAVCSVLAAGNVGGVSLNYPSVNDVIPTA